MKYKLIIPFLLLSVSGLLAQTPGNLKDIGINWACDGKKINLPYDASANRSGGSSVFSRTLAIDEIERDEYVGVIFGGTSGRSDVYVNGICLGQMMGQNLPYSFELTPFLNYDGKDSLKVVFGDVSDGAGLLQDVDIVCKSAVHFPLNGITTAQIIGGNNAQLIVSSKVENSSRSTAKVTVRHILKDAKGAEVASSLPVDAEIAPQGISCQEIGLNLLRPQMWSVSNPVLYTLVSRVESLGVVQDEEVCKIGFRTFDFIDGTGFFLNGQSIDIHPIDYVQGYPGIGGVTVPELMAFQLRELKAGGCNMVSTGGMPASEILLSLCDSMGILVLDEIASSGINDSQKQAAASMVAQAVNHPSVVFWGTGRDASPAVAGIFSDFIRTMDYTRKSVRLSDGIKGWHIDGTGTALLESGTFSKELTYSQMIEWSDKPVAYMEPEWSFAGREGKPVTLTVYSNCDRVNLGVNGGNYSSVKIVDGKAQWNVIYKPGRIDLTGYDDNRIVLKKTYNTHGYGYQIKVTPSKLKLKSDGQDIIVMDVQMLDSKGDPTPDANMQLHIYVDDNALNAYGIVDNTGTIRFSGLEILGHPGNEATIQVKDGKARFVLRSVKGSSGIAHVRVGGEALHGATFNINYE